MAYQIYRNLRKNCFSIRYKGKVIAHETDIIASQVSFKVSEAGRQRVLRTKQKNVHAVIVCDSYVVFTPADRYKCGCHIAKLTNPIEITYNPHTMTSFSAITACGTVSIPPGIVFPAALLTCSKVFV